MRRGRGKAGKVMEGGREKKERLWESGVGCYPGFPTMFITPRVIFPYLSPLVSLGPDSSSFPSDSLPSHVCISPCTLLVHRLYKPSLMSWKGHRNRLSKSDSYLKHVVLRISGKAVNIAAHLIRSTVFVTRPPTLTALFVCICAITAQRSLHMY